MDSELTLLIMLALSFPLMAILALVISIRARNRTIILGERLLNLERHMAQLQAETGQRPDHISAPQHAASAREDLSETPPTATATDDSPVNGAMAARTTADQPKGEPDAATQTAPDEAMAISHHAPSIPAQSAATPKSSSAGSFEEKLGARWSVWVGALALAIGGLMLVRFSIEQGYLGPAARVALGMILGLGLVGAGEWMRRRDLLSGRTRPDHSHAFAAPGASAALTAAGAATVFGSVYAANALYGFIGPASAFIALGIVAVLTMFSAALQGPALAAFGLPAALAAPLLISSNQPNLWAITIYAAAVVGSAYALARIRRWRWLAISAAAGAWLWGLAMVASGYDAPGAVYVHVIIQMLLAVAALAVQPQWAPADHEARTDRFALIVLTAFTLTGIAAFELTIGGAAYIAAAATMAGLMLAVGLRTVPVAGATLLSGLLVIGALWRWPVAQLSLAEPQTLAPGGVGAAPMPANLTLYFSFAFVIGLIIATLTLRRLLSGQALPLPAAVAYAGAATLTPLGVLTIVWMKTAHLAASIPFAMVAAVLAFAGVGLIARLRANPHAHMEAWRLATGAVASAVVGAIALGLTFALDKGMLTVAFALMAPGVAWIALRLNLPALRYTVGAIGLLVLARMFWNPAIAASGAIGATPVFNWLLWGYGVPALGFATAAALLARQGRGRITSLCESLAIIFTSLLVLFEIRHALNGGDPFRVSSSHLEAGLLATCALLFSMALSRMNMRRSDTVYRVASLLLSLISMAIIVIGLLVLANPLFDDEPVIGGALFNSLIPAYLLPALATGMLAAMNQAQWPRWRTLVTGAVSLALLLGYVILAIRRYFQGPFIGIDRGAGGAEWLCYTVALLAIGVGLLAWGLLKHRRLARLASSAFIVVAVLKAFLSDMADLDGIWRALSFIGLGLVLIGIARAYQLLLNPVPPGSQRPGPQTGET